MVGFIVGLFFLGLIAGAIGRLFIRSPRPLGCFGTALLGIVGSYAGGSLGAVIFHQDFDLRRASTIIGAIVGTIIILALWRTFGGKTNNRRQVHR
jgi:uncharacterized membrane protein YeaQ/YmgE (transglycosylase-associated protein family)